MFDLGATVIAASQAALIAEPIAYAFTTLVGKFGVEGKAQLAVGLVVGGGLGLSAYIAQLGAPADFAGWFALVLWTLLAAFVPAGVYEANKAASEKAIENTVIKAELK